MSMQGECSSTRVPSFTVHIVWIEMHDFRAQIDTLVCASCVCVHAQNLTKLVPQLLPAAAKAAEDASPDLRNAAMDFLAAFAVKVSTLFRITSQSCAQMHCVNALCKRIESNRIAVQHSVELQCAYACMTR